MVLKSCTLHSLVTSYLRKGKAIIEHLILSGTFVYKHTTPYRNTQHNVYLLAGYQPNRFESLLSEKTSLSGGFWTDGNGSGPLPSPRTSGSSVVGCRESVYRRRMYFLTSRPPRPPPLRLSAEERSTSEISRSKLSVLERMSALNAVRREAAELTTDSGGSERLDEASRLRVPSSLSLSRWRPSGRGDIRRDRSAAENRVPAANASSFVDTWISGSDSFTRVFMESAGEGRLLRGAGTGFNTRDTSWWWVFCWPLPPPPPTLEDDRLEKSRKTRLVSPPPPPPLSFSGVVLIGDGGGENTMAPWW